MELGYMKMTGRPWDSPSFWANSSRWIIPSTLTWWAVMGVNSPRVESRAARWKTSCTSNSERIRSSRLASRMEPTNSRATIFATPESRGFRSRVTMPRSLSFDRFSIRPCPISPPAPVTSTTGLRTRHLLGSGQAALPRRLEQQHSGGDAHVQALHGSGQRDAQAPIGALDHLAGKPRALVAEEQGQRPVEARRVVVLAVRGRGRCDGEAPGAQPTLRLDQAQSPQVGEAKRAAHG